MTTEVRDVQTGTVGELDWARVRAGFPVTETYAYLNSAGAGPVSRHVAVTAAQFYGETLESGDRLWEQRAVDFDQVGQGQAAEGALVDEAELGARVGKTDSDA